MNDRRAGITSDPARSPTLPGWAYTDAALFERERTEVFYRTWQWAGGIGDLQEPGDYLTAEVMDQSVIIIRGRDRLLGFHNVCRHRGHQLLSGCGRSTAIVCPYHAWSYDIDGALRSARGLQASEQFDADRLHLAPVQVDVLADKLVFFNLDPAARPLKDFTAGFEEELRSEVVDFDRLEQMRRLDHQDGRLPLPPARVVDANWKIVIENCLECYHCRPVHPGFRALIDMDDVRVRAHDYWASLKGHPREPQRIPDTARNKSYRFWWLWPNTFFEMSPGGAHGLTVGSWVPVDISRTTQSRSGRYGIPGTPAFEARGYGDLNLVAEDVAVMESVQRGIRSLGYDAGRFSFDPNHGETSEEAVHRFQWLIARSLDL